MSPGPGPARRTDLQRSSPLTLVTPGEGTPLQALVHTLDLLSPIGGLGQRTAWHWTDDSRRALAYALIALGWVLTTAVVAGVTHTVQRK